MKNVSYFNRRLKLKNSSNIVYIGKMGSCICGKIIGDSKGEQPPMSLETCTLENTQEISFRGKVFKAKVLEVYDGDTIIVALQFNNNFYKYRVRVYGLDTAEIRTKNLQEKKVGYEARDFLSGLILNTIVEIRTPAKDEDKYDRILGSVFYTSLDGNTKSVADIMIEKGYGYYYDGKKKKKDFSEWYNKK